MNDTIPVPVAIGLGSNKGDSLALLQRAAHALEPYIAIDKISSVYESRALYMPDQPVYLNAVLTGLTKLSPLALLWTIKDIEIELGRSPTYRYGPHEIDTDIVFYSDVVMATSELTIPHRLLTERDFVLYPLNEIAPEWIHPQTGKTVAQLHAALPSSEIKCLGRLI